MTKSLRKGAKLSTAALESASDVVAGAEATKVVQSADQFSGAPARGINIAADHVSINANCEVVLEQ